jgi:hypothetical protein
MSKKKEGFSVLFDFLIDKLVVVNGNEFTVSELADFEKLDCVFML